MKKGSERPEEEQRKSRAEPEAHARAEELERGTLRSAQFAFDVHPCQL